MVLVVSGQRVRAGRSSRTWRLVVLAAVLVYVPLVVMAVWSVHLTETAIRGQAEARVAGTAAASAAAVDHELKGLADVVESYSTRLTLVTAMGTGDPDQIDRQMVAFQLSALNRAGPRDGIAFLATAEGALVDIVPATPEIVGGDFSYRDWFKGVSVTGATYVSRVYKTKATGGGLVVAVAAPIRSADGANVVGLLVAGYRVDSLQAFVDRFASAQGVDLLVTDQAGTLVAAPGRAQTNIVDLHRDPDVAASLAGRSGAGTREIDGESSISAFVPVPRIGWTVTARVHSSDALALAADARRAVAVISGLLALLLAIGLVLVARQLRRQDEARQAVHDARLEADRANEAKSHFVSRMSHELRTPLNAILGFAQLAEMDAEEPTKDNLRQIVKGGRHLLALINELLDMAAIEGGRLAISLEPVDVAEITEEVLELLRPLADQGHVRLVNAVPAAGPCVRADRQRLKQVLLNLVANGIKYHHLDGTVVVSCESHAEHVRISVTDDGPGILAEQQSKIFEPFERLSEEMSGVEGTGLGLALSSRLVQMMHGSIGVDVGAPAGGSTFWIELATADLPRATKHPANSDPEAPLSEQPQLRLLCIEDNPVNVLLLERIFARRGGTVLQAAATGAQGVELAQRDVPDVILLDLHLPDFSGHEVLRRLQAEPSTRDIPVVMVTADATPRQVARLKQQGAAAYVTKPFDVQHLLATVDRLAPGPQAVSTQAGGAPSYDLGILLETLGEALGGAGLAALLDVFNEECKGHIDRLQVLRTTQPLNEVEVRRIAHTLRGSANLFGAAHIAELLMRLESPSTEGDIGPLLDEVIVGLRQLERATTTARTRLGPLGSDAPGEQVSQT